MPAYDDYRNTAFSELLSRVRFARAAVLELATAMFTEGLVARPPRTRATEATTNPSAVETLAVPPLRARETLMNIGEAVVDPAEAARRSELARGLMSTALACITIEPDSRPNALDIFGRVRHLENAARNAHVQAMEGGEQPALGGGVLQNAAPHLTLAVDAPQPARHPLPPETSGAESSSLPAH